MLAWNNSALFLGIALGSLIGGQATTYGSFPGSLVICGGIAVVAWLVNRLVAPASNRAKAAKLPVTNILPATLDRTDPPGRAPS